MWHADRVAAATDNSDPDAVVSLQTPGFVLRQARMLLYVTASNSFSFSFTENSYQSSMPSWKVIGIFFFNPVTCVNLPTLSTKESLLTDLQPGKTNSQSLSYF